MDNNLLSPLLRGMIVNSDEPLWDWDIHTDSLFWSRGALKLLKLDNPPSHMKEYYRLLPPDAAEELLSAREGILSGDAGPSLECDYLCNDMWIHEVLIVMARDEDGRALRVLGTFKVMEIDQGALGFYQNTGHLSDVGAWVYHVPSGKVWRDKACRTILGHEDNGMSVVSSNVPLLEVHPSERSALMRHYQLFCDSGRLGDHITDIVRIRNGNGDYEPILVRASAVERDGRDKAVLVAGIIAANDQSQQRAEDNGDKVFHAFHSMGNGQWTWDAHNGSINVCDKFLSMLGYDNESGTSPGQFWMEHIHPDDTKNIQESRQTIIATPDNGDTYECTYRVRCSDGEWAWIFERGCVIWRDQNGQAGNMLGSITNITTAQAEREKLEALVRTDALTGVHSRGYCDLRLEQLEHNGVRPVSIISIDINGLKMINDNLGHAAGDELLLQTGHILKETLRSTDFIARTGGDEFLVLLSGYPLATAKKIMAKIEAALQASQTGEHGLPVFAACGVACAETLKETLTDTIAKADEAMYKNKRATREFTRKRITEWIKQKTGKEPENDDRV